MVPAQGLQTVEGYTEDKWTQSLRLNSEPDQDIECSGVASDTLLNRVDHSGKSLQRLWAIHQNRELRERG